MKRSHIALNNKFCVLAKAKELSPLQKEYQQFFKDLMKKYGVSSPAELDEDKKAEFFSEIEYRWEEGKGVINPIEESSVKERKLYVALSTVLTKALGSIPPQVERDIEEGVTLTELLDTILELPKKQLQEIRNYVTNNLDINIRTNKLDTYISYLVSQLNNRQVQLRIQELSSEKSPQMEHLTNIKSSLDHLIGSNDLPEHVQHLLVKAQDKINAAYVLCEEL